MRFIANSLKRNFIAGLLVTVPFGLTLLILFKLAQWMAELVSALPANVLQSLYNMPQPAVRAVSVAVGLLGTFLVVVAVGMVARNIVGGKLLHFGERVIAKIPLARTIYTATKQVIETLLGEEGFVRSRKVVLVEYPRKDMYALGFVTGTVSYPGETASAEDRQVGVFIPTSPNPTSGFFVITRESELRVLDLGTEEAFKIIMSLGLAKHTSESIVIGKEDDPDPSDARKG